MTSHYGDQQVKHVYTGRFQNIGTSGNNNINYSR